VSDADDQMGGTGGDTGAPPGAASGPGPEDAEHPATDDSADLDRVTEDSEESFPASDPPATY
jgi:hypothetical protein